MTTTGTPGFTATPGFYAEFNRFLYNKLRETGATPAGLALFAYALLWGSGELPESEKYPGKQETPAEFLAKVLKDVPIEDRLEPLKKFVGVNACQTTP